MAKLSKEQINLIIFVMILILLLVLGIFLYQRIYKQSLKDNTNPNGGEALMTPIILQNDKSKVVESNALPTDIDLTFALPEFSPTTKITAVTDVTRTDGRLITVKYEVNRDVATVKQLVIDHLKVNKWEVDENQGTVVESNIGKTTATIFIDTLDNEKTFLTVAINIPN